MMMAGDFGHAWATSFAYVASVVSTTVCSAIVAFDTMATGVDGFLPPLIRLAATSGIVLSAMKKTMTGDEAARLSQSMLTGSSPVASRPVTKLTTLFTSRWVVGMEAYVRPPIPAVTPGMTRKLI